MSHNKDAVNLELHAQGGKIMYDQEDQDKASAKSRDLDHRKIFAGRYSVCRRFFQPHPSKGRKPNKLRPRAKSRTFS
jgi:hypothetical protein